MAVKSFRFKNTPEDQERARQMTEALRGAMPMAAGVKPETEVTRAVLYEVLVERARQDAKWGQQNHPNGTGGPGLGERAVLARNWCQRLAAEGNCTWMAILEEEITEAYAERDPEKLRSELVQAAAVIAAWIECIDRHARQEAE